MSVNLGFSAYSPFNSSTMFDCAGAYLTDTGFSMTHSKLPLSADWLLKKHARQAELHATLSVDLSRAETDQFTLPQLSLQPLRLLVSLWCKLALKERAATRPGRYS